MVQLRNGFEQYQFIVNGGCCDICEEISGKVFDVAKMMPGENAPPMHPYCRCSTAAYSDRKEYDAWLEYLENGGTTAVWEDYGKAEWEKALAKSTKSSTMKMNLQFFARNSRDYKTITLPKDEYAHVMSELNTHLSDEQRKQKVVTKAIGNYYYTIENNGFNEYRIIGKEAIDEDFLEWWDE